MSRSTTMYNSDKERVLGSNSEDEQPKIKVYTSKALQAAKKPWCASGLALCVAAFAVLVSFGVLFSCLAWFGVLPEKVMKLGVFPFIEEHEKRIYDLEKHTNICVLPKDSGNCYEMIPRWYFDKERATCLQFVYSGCMGNANNFMSSDECNERCFSWGDDGIEVPDTIKGRPDGFRPSCEGAPDAGPCKENIPRYYFDDRDKECKKFLYGGCAGNSNNFLTESECKQTCLSSGRILPELPDYSCQLTPEMGPCRGMMEKWFFSPDQGECQTFIYGGCGGNDNNFASKEKCEARCKASAKSVEASPAEICSLSSETGPCRGALPRFFFNTKSGKCEMFAYGGCAGNKNNFESPEDCRRFCLAP